MYEFGDIRLRPMEREDLKVLHEWENDFELTMYSRNVPIDPVNMAQLEKRYEEWTRDAREMRFVVELAKSREAIGIARL